ncbi:XdhC family protein [Bacillus sp. N1-1]|uniref:XdhC family protein n=1 Tax=Bacillus sp. N1-1 TaxID=2682541 RepID=UPI0013176795|nr:XdhC family protein [Bacillus sp. N1-1]QHA93094.1 XdhC/CoxI family protein [Bacillus sp. N1-1]
MLPIYEEIKRCLVEGKKGVLGTIIRTEGSTYQKVGAKCFLSEDGFLTGLVSGGCVEGDIAEHAKAVLDTGQPKKVFYDFRDTGDDLWGLGLGCNGSIEIYLEPFEPTQDSSKDIEESFSRAFDHPLCHIIIISSDSSSPSGSKRIFMDEKSKVDTIRDERIRQAYVDRLEEKKTGLYIDEKLEVFFEFVIPDPHVIVFGAGPDAVPLVNGVKQLNWRVSVIDHRPEYVSRNHFPNAHELIVSSKRKIPEISLNEQSFIVIMTHHFEQDQLILNELLGAPTGYIGILGPRKRSYQLLEGISRDTGISEHELLNFFSPIGLDIGAKTPEEISYSIIAEMINVFREGNGISLKMTKGPYIWGNEEKRKEEVSLTK